MEKILPAFPPWMNLRIAPWILCEFQKRFLGFHTEIPLEISRRVFLEIFPEAVQIVLPDISKEIPALGILSGNSPKKNE